mgnify:CR=1 FL=1
MYKTAFFGLVGIVILALVGGAAYFFGQGKINVSISPTSSPEATFLGTPVPTTDDQAAIKQAVYTKFNSDATKLNVTVSKIDGKYATGGIVDVGSEVGGGYFLAAKWQGNWVIVHDGQAQPTCAQIAPYDFPVTMVPECLNASGKVVKR